MKAILVAALVALAVSILFTPYLIKVFSRQGFGGEIREDGPQHHKKKRGTPTMGGTSILIAMWCGYLAAKLVDWISGGGDGFTASGLLLLYLTTGMGSGRLPGRLHQAPQAAQPRAEQADEVPRADVRGRHLRHRRAVLPGRGWSDPGLGVAVLRAGPDAFLSIGAIGFVVLCWLLVSAWSNAVNFTDGTDGLAAGSSVMVLGTYVAIGFFQFRNACWMPRCPPPRRPAATRCATRWTSR